jgi:hypothetical protein
MLRPTVAIEEKSNAFDAMRADLKLLSDAFVKVGFPEGAKPGKPKNILVDAKPYEDMSEVARIATWNEFGVAKTQIETMRGIMTGRSASNWKLPPRNFFRSAVDGSNEQLKNVKERLYQQFLLGRLTAVQVLDSLGLWMQAKIRNSIIHGNWTPNAPSTIKQKGSSKPLIDSSQMLNSVTWVNSLSKAK